MDLHRAISDYHSLLDATSAQATFEHLDHELRALRMLVGAHRDRLVCSVLRPRFVTQAQYTTLCNATRLVGRAIQRVGHAALHDETLLAPYALSATERELLEIDPGYPAVAAFGRLDGFLAADGSACLFVEANLESPAGIAYDEAIATIFEQTELLNAFRQHYHATALPVRQGLQHLLLDSYRAWGGNDTPSIAIVDFAGAVTRSEFEWLRDRFVADGIPTVITDPGELRYTGGRLYAGDMPINLVYRRVLQHEFLAQYDLSHPLVQAYADRAVCVVNSFCTKPVHTKLIMWLLSDEDGPAAGLLDAEEQAAVARHVPWTRRLHAGESRYRGDRVNLVAFARRHRERLVLKPNDAYGGKGVLLGWETDPTEWEAALDAALAGPPHVLQERVPVPQEDYPTWSPEAGLQITPRYVDSDPCLFGAEAVGCLTRIASTALLNVSAGGGSAPPTFLID